ncbi:MAG: hypothetical protein Fur0046_37000 [Cyanobacteria bacterium J069]
MRGDLPPNGAAAGDRVKMSGAKKGQGGPAGVDLKTGRRAIA